MMRLLSNAMACCNVEEIPQTAVLVGYRSVKPSAIKGCGTDSQVQLEIWPAEIS